METRMLPRALREITHGYPVRHVHASGFWLTDVTYPARAHYAPHAHGRTYVSFVLRGGFSEHVGKVAMDVVGTTVVIMPRHRMHENRMGPEATRSLVVTLEPGFERLIPNWKRVSEQPQWITRGIPLHLLLRIYRSFRLAPTSEMSVIEESLFAMFGVLDKQCRRNAVPNKESFRRVIEFLHEWYASPIRLEEVAALLNWNPAYLCRAFRQRFGCTIGDYVRDLRARKAMRLAASSEVPLAEVAATCGFADQSHLTRVFKALTGMPPGAYRRFVCTP